MVDYLKISGFLQDISRTFGGFINNSLKYIFSNFYGLSISDENFVLLVSFFTLLYYFVLSIVISWLFYKIVVGFIRLFV